MGTRQVSDTRMIVANGQKSTYRKVFARNVARDDIMCPYCMVLEETFATGFDFHGDVDLSECPSVETPVAAAAEMEARAVVLGRVREGWDRLT